MRTLISNLNVIRATGVYGVLCNGINGISTRIEMLTERIADTAWRAVMACHQELVARHEERLHERQFHKESRETFWKPLDASAGSFSFGIGSENRSRFSQGGTIRVTPDRDHGDNDKCCS